MRVAAGLAVHHRTPDRLHARRPVVERPATGQQARGARRRERPAVVRAAGDEREPGAGVERQRHAARPAPAPPPALAGDHHARVAGLAEGGERRVERRRRPRRGASSARLVAGRHAARASATSCSRVRRGCTTQILRARARRPCAAAGAGSGSPARRPGPTTRIACARSTSRVRHGHRAAGAPRTLGLAGARRPAVVEVVRAEHRPRELGQRVVVLVHQAATGEDRRRACRAVHSATRVSTSPNDAGSSPRSRISGVVMRSGASGKRNANRPLSHSHASFTS